MREIKCLGKLADGKTAVFTFSQDNFNYLLSLAKFYGVSAGSEEFGSIVLSAARDGLARSVRITDQTREEIVKGEEDKGFTINHVNPEELDNGL